MQKSKRRFRIQISDIILIVPILVTFAWPEKLINGNLFWQIRAGDWILKNKAVLNYDIFSFAKNGHEWVNINWIPEIIFSIVYKNFGFRGTALLSGIIIGISFVILFRIAIKNYKNSVYIFLSIGFAMFVSMGQWLANANVFSFLYISLYILILDKVSIHKSRYLFFLIPIQIMWVNSNQLYFVGNIILIFYGFGILVEKVISKKSNKILLGDVFLITVLGLLVNIISPYGIGTYIESIKIIAEKLYMKSNEWSSPDFHVNTEMNFYFVFLLLLIMTSNIKQRKYAYEYLPLFGMSIFLYLHSQLFLPLFLFVSVIFISKLQNYRYITEKKYNIVRFFIRRILNHDKDSNVNLLFKLLFIILITIIVILLNNRNPVQIEETYMPVKAYSALIEQKVSGRGFCDDIYADYLIWNRWKDGVMIDSRTSFFCDTNVIYDYGRIKNLGIGWYSLFGKYNIKWILLSRYSHCYTALMSSYYDKWKTIYTDEEYILLIRR